MGKNYCIKNTHQAPHSQPMASKWFKFIGLGFFLGGGGSMTKLAFKQRSPGKDKIETDRNCDRSENKNSLSIGRSVSQLFAESLPNKNLEIFKSLALGDDRDKCRSRPWLCRQRSISVFRFRGRVINKRKF